MDTKIAALGGAPDLGPSQTPASSQPSPEDKAPASTGPDPIETRLIIEQDQASGSYVYKTVNRLTGEVVQQLPRAEVLKLRDELHYAAGKLVRTEA